MGIRQKAVFQTSGVLRIWYMHKHICLSLSWFPRDIHVEHVSMQCCKKSNKTEEPGESEFKLLLFS